MDQAKTADLRTPSTLLSAARVPRKAAVLTKEGLFGAGVSGVLFAGPDEGGSWRTTLAEGPGGGSSQGAGVGVIVIEGALEQRAQFGMCEAFVDGYDAIEARYDAAISAYQAGEIGRIATVINSPGGVRQGLFATARRVRSKLEAAGVPTMAVADEDCCSAAWVWALVSDKLYAPPDARVGSIGAVTIAESVAGKLAKDGREVRVYRSGERKMRPSGVEPFTEEDDAELQARADSGGVLIAEWTAERRGGTKDDYLALKGAVFSGQEAARRGLIDGLMSAHEVIDMAIAEGVSSRNAIVEALGLAATVSDEEAVKMAREGTIARAEVAQTRIKLAEAEGKLLALSEAQTRDKATQEAAQKRAAFAAEIKAACSVDRTITTAAEASLLAHYDAHGEASARSTFALVKSPAPIVPTGKTGGLAPTSAANVSPEIAARAKELGVSPQEYAGLPAEVS